MEQRHEPRNPRKAYEAPRVIHTELVEGRASTCGQSDDNTCGGSVIAS